jgi:hypothetical protein
MDKIDESKIISIVLHVLLQSPWFSNRRPTLLRRVGNTTLFQIHLSLAASHNYCQQHGAKMHSDPDTEGC